MVIKRQHILYFILLAIFMGFSPLNEYIRGGRVGHGLTNYIIPFTICFFLLLFNKIPRNKDTFRIFFVLFCVVLINFIFAPYRNAKLFLIQIVFFLVSYYTAAIYSHIGSRYYDSVGRNIEKICNAGVFIVACISIYLLMRSYNILISIVTEGGSFNNYLYGLYSYLYWNKHAIGGTIGILCCHILTSPNHRFRNLFFLMPVIPIILSIRHIQLGFFLTAIVLNIRKERNLFLLFLVLLLSIFAFWDRFVSILQLDVRIMSLINTVTIVTEYPFGVGNNMFYTFVTDNIDKLSNQFSHLYSEAITTETDFVYVFSSFGLLPGLIFYAIIAVIVFRLWKLYPNLIYPDKFFALVFIYFFFAGIGEDWMFGFSYWLLFGFALGVVAAKRNRFVGKSTRSRGKIHV